MQTKRTLALLRHGEADLGFGHSADIHRPLTAKGRAQLARLGKLLDPDSFDLILYSPSARTTETYGILVEEVKGGTAEAIGNIYNASLNTLLDILQDVPTAYGSVLLIGHNPGVSHLQGYLTGDVSLVFSPGMMVKMDLEVDEWSMLSSGTCSLVEVLQ